MNRREFNTLLAGLPSIQAGEPSAAASQAMRLWYRQPATRWLEALALGNGRMGAMVFGGVPVERIVLNESTLYAEEPGGRNLPLDITKDFDQVVAMIRRGDFAEAEEHVKQHWLGRSWPCYQPLGDLILDFGAAAEFTEYTRDLDLQEAVSRVRYQQAGVKFEREYFASHPDNVIVARIKTDRPGAVNFKVRLDSVHPNLRTRAQGQSGIIISGQVPGIALRRELDWVEKRGEQWKYPEIWNRDGSRKPNARQALYGAEVDGRGMRFEVRIEARSDSGRVTNANGALAVESANEAVLLIAIATSFNGYDKSPSRQGADAAAANAATLEKAGPKPFPQIRQAHVADYRKLYDRVVIDLGQQSALPTDERIALHGKGGDPALAALYFQFGRYLTIASSRPGSQPMNLQGLWNVDVIPPWGGAYTTNINLQMNYWPAEVANLSECTEPLFRMLKETSVSGARTARDMYHRPGWVLHHDTSIWRDTQPVDNEAFFSFWPMAGGWLCRHLWEHYLYTDDKEFLRAQAYPLMKGSAEFYSAWLVDDGTGHLTTPVSSSPENRFRYTDRNGKERNAGIAMGCTLDLAVIRELFGNVVQAASLLGVDSALRARLSGQKDKLAPFKIGKEGQLLEYFQEFREDGPRHDTSPFYPLFPGCQITEKTPELLEAERVLVHRRARNSGQWPGAWHACCFARLNEPATAQRSLRLLIGTTSHPNLFNGQGTIFQIDGNLGGVAAIAEMLLQSHTDEIRLLPSSSPEWQTGSVRGLRARGGHEIAMDWREGLLTSCRIKAGRGETVRLRLPAGQKIREIQCRGSAIGTRSEAGGTTSFPAQPDQVYVVTFA